MIVMMIILIAVVVIKTRAHGWLAEWQTMAGM